MDIMLTGLMEYSGVRHEQALWSMPHRLIQRTFGPIYKVVGSHVLPLHNHQSVAARRDAKVPNSISHIYVQTSMTQMIADILTDMNMCTYICRAAIKKWARKGSSYPTIIWFSPKSISKSGSYTPLLFV